MLAAGARQNISSDAPMPGAGNFQLNIDGQEVTNNMVQSFGQPKFSRDSIGEFELIANRFDASQGRSMGIQVNAITKSGTNTNAGTFSGYFRDDKFVAKDFVQNRVLPYQNQQFSVTFGGPIRRMTGSTTSPTSSMSANRRRSATRVRSPASTSTRRARNGKEGRSEDGLPVHLADAPHIPWQLGRVLPARSALFRRCGTAPPAASRPAVRTTTSR